MKSILAICLLLATFSSQAKIWRVNNNVGVAANFTTLQAAHDGAAAGDTISLESSANSYGALTATKKLIIIGPGYFHVQNNPTSPIVNSATIGTVTLSTGSSGSSISGVTGSSININVSNVTIARTISGTIGIGPNISNLLIAQNYDTSIFASVASNSTNILVTNNSLQGNGTSWPASCQALIINNILISTGGFLFYGQTLSNNIAIGANVISLTNCILSNNIDATTLTRFGTTNGNIGNVTEAQVFVGAAGNTTDSQWKLKSGSPAIGAGLGGIDCGMYGGSTPYQLSGLPAIPAFTKLITTGVSSNTTPLQITVTVESKN